MRRSHVYPSVVTAGSCHGSESPLAALLFRLGSALRLAVKGATSAAPAQYQVLQQKSQILMT